MAHGSYPSNQLQQCYGVVEHYIGKCCKYSTHSEDRYDSHANAKRETNCFPGMSRCQSLWYHGEHLDTMAHGL